MLWRKRFSLFTFHPHCQATQLAWLSGSFEHLFSCLSIFGHITASTKLLLSHYKAVLFTIKSTMSLCSLCQSIPFEALGSMPKCDPNEPVHVTSHAPDLLIFLLVEPSPLPNKQLGFSHHKSLEILAASAETCGLCEILHSSFNA
jgi:hypothetical protein